jgi:replication factor C subunit 1
MDALIESAQGDLRIMLGQLQMHRLRSSSLSFENVKATATKDMDKSPFDCARRLLSNESAQWSAMDKLDAVFQDMDLVPLLIQVFCLPDATSSTCDKLSLLSTLGLM